MESDVKFFELLKETADLVKDYRPFNRGSMSKQISLVLQRQLIKLMPKTVTDYNLQSFEMLFLCVLLVEPDACRDILRHFSRFWACSYEGSLKTQMALETSIHEGSLQSFIEDDGSSRIRIKDDLRLRFLTALFRHPTIEGTE